MDDSIVLEVAEESEHVASYKREQCADERGEFLFTHSLNKWQDLEQT